MYHDVTRSLSDLTIPGSDHLPVCQQSMCERHIPECRLIKKQHAAPQETNQIEMIHASSTHRQ